ncbi:hypothetical protein GC170_13500 [bacterium]|nr:hypothetical protein [bacterium]
MSRMIKKRRSFFAAIETMERRQVLSSVPVLMTDGSLASQPTWGQTPSVPIDQTANSFFSAESVITTDIYGNPIDFDRDGFADLLETGNADSYVGYGTHTSMDSAASRGTFGKVAFGGPNGPVFSDKGTQAVGSVTVQTTGSLQAVADLNGDGYQDILTTVSNSATAGSGFHMEQWIFDPQQRTFAKTALPTTIQGWANKTGQMTLGDVTGDGVPDLVTQNFSTTPVAYPQNSSSLVFPMTGFQVFAGVTSGGAWRGDFAATPTSTLTLRQPSADWGVVESGSNSGQVAAPYGSVSVINSVLADFNGDGNLDLAIPEADGVTVFPNPGNGVFVQASGVFAPSAGAANGLNLVAGDVNNDGKIDLASSPNYVSQWLKRSPSDSFTVWAASSAPISVYMNTTPAGGPIGFTTNAVNAFETQSGWNGTIALADFNGDGNLDIAVASGSNQARLYGIVAGDGTGHFGALRQYLGYSDSADGYDNSYQRAIDFLAVSDFNHDGQVDIVVTAVNIGPAGTEPAPPNYPNNPAVGITGISYNRTFAAPGVDPQSLTAYVGQSFAGQLTATGGDASKPYVFSLNPRSVPLPPGMSLSPSGQLTGTPGVSGPFQLTIDIVQPNGPRGTSYLYLNVVTPQQSAILPGIMPNAVAGLEFRQQLTATLGPATWALTGGALPTGLTLTADGLISGTPLATGSYAFTVLGTGAGFQSVMNYELQVQAAAAPVVTGLARYGYHQQPSILVVSFSQDMDSQSASRLSNYLLVSAGRDGRFGTRDDRGVPLASAIYDTSTRTVTLSPASRTLPLHQLYRLTITGNPAAGVKNTSDVFLGGQGVGLPGTNYVRDFTGAGILAGPNALIRSVRPKTIKKR